MEFPGCEREVPKGLSDVSAGVDSRVSLNSFYECASAWRSSPGGGLRHGPGSVAEDDFSSFCGYVRFSGERGRGGRQAIVSESVFLDALVSHVERGGLGWPQIVGGVVGEPGDP